MIASLEDLQAVLKLVFQDALPPKPLHLVEPMDRVRRGVESPPEAARRAGTTPRRLTQLCEAREPLSELLGGTVLELMPEFEGRVRNTLGQLLIGSLAERVFEDLYRSTVGNSELELRDDRSTRGDTDYLVFNGRGRQVFRINIKFHGSLFRRSRDLVGLDPEDCFALATYKIYAALKKQDTEHLPYIFVIVGVPGLTGNLVGQSLPGETVELSALSHASRKVTGKRMIEDQIVARLTGEPAVFGFEAVTEHYLHEIRGARWFVLSARRAYNLLRELLFDRAYALRVRAFARNYPGAELDMHFSLSDDLCPLDEFLAVLRDHGMPGLVSRLERGTL